MPVMADSSARENAVSVEQFEGCLLGLALGDGVSRGYGPGTTRVLKRVARGMHWRVASRVVHGDGSFGNGAALRAAVVGLFFCDHPDDLKVAAHLSASVTHAHPLGMEGAALIASATAAALAGRNPHAILQGAFTVCRLEPFTTRLQTAIRWLESVEQPNSRE